MQIQVFTDFDGTITLQDTGVVLVDHPTSMGMIKRKALDKSMLDGEITFRELFVKEWDSVHFTYDEAWELMKDIKVDPGFPSFFEFCDQQQIPVTVVSSGLRPTIARFLELFLGEESKKIEVISNDVEITDRTWKVLFRDETPHGHDKSLALTAARERHPEAVLIFCGDGVSDISAAKHADLLFARKDCDLETWCRREHVPFTSFDTFEDVHQVVESICNGSKALVKDETGFYRLQ